MQARQALGRFDQIDIFPKGEELADALRTEELAMLHHLRGLAQVMQGINKAVLSCALQPKRQERSAFKLPAWWS